MKQYIASLITESELSKIDNMTLAIVIARHRPVGSFNFAGKSSKVELPKTQLRIANAYAHTYMDLHDSVLMSGLY